MNVTSMILLFDFSGTYFGCGTGGRREARGGLGTRWLWRCGAEGGRVPGQDLHTPRDDGVWDLRTHKAHSAQTATAQHWRCLPSPRMPKGDNEMLTQEIKGKWYYEMMKVKQKYGEEVRVQGFNGVMRTLTNLWLDNEGGVLPCVAGIHAVGQSWTSMKGWWRWGDYTGQMHTVMDFFFLFITSPLCFFGFNVLTALLLLLITGITTDQTYTLLHFISRKKGQ